MFECEKCGKEDEGARDMNLCGSISARICIKCLRRFQTYIIQTGVYKEYIISSSKIKHAEGNLEQIHKDDYIKLNIENNEIVITLNHEINLWLKE